jgi:hypothetical protein
VEQEVQGNAEWNRDLGDRSHHGRDEVRKRVRQEVAELVKPEIDQTEQRHTAPPNERDPSKEEANKDPNAIPPALPVE